MITYRENEDIGFFFLKIPKNWSGGVLKAVKSDYPAGHTTASAPAFIKSYLVANIKLVWISTPKRPFYN